LNSCHNSVLQPRYCRNNTGLGFSRFARHYFGNHFCFLLLWVLRCFSSPRSPSANNGMIQSSRIGLPHSDIHGSIRICQSPRLFAAYHVLLRLPEPRHPPCALIHFLFAVRFHTEDRSSLQPGLINTSVYCSIVFNELYLLCYLLLFYISSCQRSLQSFIGIETNHDR
jgi:hypothetical protein